MAWRNIGVDQNTVSAVVHCVSEMGAVVDCVSKMVAVVHCIDTDTM